MSTPPPLASVTPTLENVLARIDGEYKTRMANVSPLRPNNYAELLRETEKLTVDFLQQVTKTPASGKQPSAIVESIRSRRSALSLTSDITTEVVGVCKQILAFGAAGLGLSLGFADKIRLLPPGLQKALVIGGIVYFELILVSLLVLCWYLLQAHFRYPFLHFQQIGNTWPWFYYATVSPDVPRWPVQFPSQVLRGATLYAQDLARFADRVVNETDQEELRLELQQYFLLLAFQGYVNQFSLRMTNLFFYGITGALVTLITLAIWAVSK
jgi:hypothetical protein